nr:tetratricopeptide repeat protein [Atopomonas sediminilitoris]
MLSTLALSLLLAGCANNQRGAVPVVDAGQRVGEGTAASAQPSAPSVPQDNGVVVMVPDAPVSSQPIQVSPAGGSGFVPPPAADTGGWVPPAPAAAPAPISSQPLNTTLAGDEQLAGPVLALLTTAKQQEGSGDLNGAAASLERAQRIAPREPQVLYHLGRVRLAQGDAAQAEQFARQGLSYAQGRPTLQAELWNLIAQARERQGDAAGAAAARQNVRVPL